MHNRASFVCYLRIPQIFGEMWIFKSKTFSSSDVLIRTSHQSLRFFSFNLIFKCSQTACVRKCTHKYVQKKPHIEDELKLLLLVYHQVKLEGHENQEVKVQEQRYFSQQENLLLFNFNYFVTLKLEEIKRLKTTKTSFEVAQLRFRKENALLFFLKHLFTTKERKKTFGKK